MVPRNSPTQQYCRFCDLRKNGGNGKISVMGVTYYNLRKTYKWDLKTSSGIVGEGEAVKGSITGKKSQQTKTKVPAILLNPKYFKFTSNVKEHIVIVKLKNDISCCRFIRQNRLKLQVKGLYHTLSVSG